MTTFEMLKNATVSFNRKDKETGEKTTITRTVGEDNFDHICKEDTFKSLYGCLSAIYKNAIRIAETTSDKVREDSSAKLDKAISDYLSQVGLHSSFKALVTMSCNARLAKRNGETIATLCSEKTFIKAVLRLTNHAITTGAWTDAKPSKDKDTTVITNVSFVDYLAMSAKAKGISVEKMREELMSQLIAG